MFPVARTAMDKRGGTSINNYTKDLRKSLERMTPWKKNSRVDRSRLKSGEVVVMIDAHDRISDELYKDATVSKG